MPKHKFIRENFNLSESKVEIKDRRLIHQINNVLRMSPGDVIGLCDGQRSEAKGKIQDISKDKVIVEILEQYKNEKEPQTQVSLYCSILKNKNFDWVVQKATELGVKKIVPIISERTVKTGLKSDRLRKKIREAAELSDRGEVPNLADKMKFQEALTTLSDKDFKILFDRSGQETDFNNLKYDSVSVFVGSEGGWSDSELEQARKNDLEILKLSDLNLRAETAAVVGSYEVLK